MTTSKPTKDGLVYGPIGSGKTYMSAYHHRGTQNPHKTCWSRDFPPDDEFRLFERGDDGNWYSCKGDQWGITEGGRRTVGTGGERMSFCPKNVNATDPWHGYPVTARSRDYKVPEEILDKWVQQKIIDAITAKRIRGERL